VPYLEVVTELKEAMACEEMAYRAETTTSLILIHDIHPRLCRSRQNDYTI
jgi:hypothetical protein